MADQLGSYFYSVNRDNPLGYFSIDFNYTYADFDSAYTPYGGTVNLTPGSTAYSTLPIKDPYRLISNYGNVATFKLTDQSYIDNIPSVFGVSYSSPIVSGNKYAAQITSNSKLEIINLYDSFVPASASDIWSTEFWASLDWMDGQGLDATGVNSFTTNNYRTDIGFRSTFNSQAKINLMDIGYYVNDVWTAYGSIVYNQANNCIEFYVPKIDGTYAKAYAPVKNLDIPMHVYVSYSNKTINVIVNGKTGISASVGNGLKLDGNIGNNSQNLKFRIAGEIYNPLYPTQSTYLQNGQYFLISDLAFYNYILNSNQIHNHMRWAVYDNKPMLTSIRGNTHFFTLEEFQENYQYRRIFNGKDFNNYTQIYNLNVTPEGLSPTNLTRVSFNNIDGTSTLIAESEHDIYTVSPDPGVSWSGGKAALEYNQFGSLIQPPCTISLILEPLPNGSPAYGNEYIFSISGVNGISTLYVERSGTSTYSLVYYDAMNGGTTTTLASVTSNNTKEYHKIALSISGSSAQLTCVSSSNQDIASATDPVSTATSTSQTFSFTTGSSLTIGQSYHLGNAVSDLRSNNTQFSYLSMTDSYITNFTYTDQYINGYHYSYGYPWTQTLKYSTPLQYNGDFYDPTATNTTFPMYQTGYWITTIPLTSIDSVLGSKVDWTSTNSCLVEYSFYNPSISHQEQNWYTLSRRGAFMSGFDFTKELSNVLIRVTILSEYDVNEINQTFNNLQVGFYRNMNFYSDDNSFILKPKSISNYNSSYTIKSHAKQIQCRSNNLGVLFPYSSHDGKVPGYGQIVNTNGISIKGIDFWFRPDTNYTNSVVLSALSSVSNFPHLYINSVNAFAWNSNISAVYINGKAITNPNNASVPDDFTSEYTVVGFNPIHIVVQFANSFTGDLYINGVPETTSAQSVTFNSSNQSNSTYTTTSGTTTFTMPAYSSITAGQSSTSGVFAVTPTRTYTVTANIQESVANSRTAQIVINYYDSGGTFLSSQTQTAVSIGTTAVAFNYVGTAPTSSAFASVDFVFIGPKTGEIYSISNLAVTDSVSGAITISKIGNPYSKVSGCSVVYSASGDTTTVTVDSLVSPVIFSQSLSSNRFSIAKKSMFYATANMSESSSYTTLGGARTAALAINWIDGSGALISTTVGNPITLSTNSLSLSVSSFPPDNAVYGNYSVYIYNTDASESYLFSGTILAINIAAPEASYGFINIWENISVPQDAVNRYALFTTNTVALLENDNYMNDTSNRLSFDMAKESLYVHKIGN